MVTRQKVEAWIAQAKQAAKTPEGRQAVEHVQVHACGYAEPGYNCKKNQLIALGNWNTISRFNETTRVFDTLDTAPEDLLRTLTGGDVLTEWEDEWIACSVCQGLLRTQPDGWGWKQSYAQVDDCGGPVCLGCLLKDTAMLRGYLASIEGETHTSVTFDAPLEKLGYLQLNDEPMERGLCGGQAADPEKIAENFLNTSTQVSRFIFVLDDVEQFGATFSVWVHRDEFRSGSRYSPNRFKQFKTWFNEQNWDGADPAEGMKRALASASVAMATLPEGQGIKYAKLHADGTADVRLVGAQEFANGIKD